MIEAEGGVRVIIKRELFHGIQQGGRIDPKTGRLINADDTKNVTNDVTKKLTERQRVILEMLPIGDIENVTETTSTLAQKTGVLKGKNISGLFGKRIPAFYRMPISVALWMRSATLRTSILL